MRKLIAWVLRQSLDGLLADDGTEYWQFCFGVPQDPADLKQKIDLYERVRAHHGPNRLRGHGRGLADG